MRLARLLARSLACSRGYRSRLEAESLGRKNFSAAPLGRARRLASSFAISLARSFAHSLVRSLTRNVRAREKMGFPGVELQVEISIGGQREVS